MPSCSEDVAQSFLKSIEASQQSDEPYRYWILRDCFPDDILRELIDLPFSTPDLGGLSGKRELHNKTRRYFDLENQKKFTSIHVVSEAFQKKTITGQIADYFKTDLTGSYLRIEYAQDTDGFWLEPHTDLGVKLFTMLLYISEDPDHYSLGTDIYDDEKRHVGRSIFLPNAALVFVPSDITYHGFENRPIKGVRKSVIINYVTDEWRAREQLAFPEQKIQ